MDVTGSISTQLTGDGSFKAQLAAALRGGVVMLIGSAVWGLFPPRHSDPFVALCFFWLPSAWLVFPLGAFLGRFLPRWMANRSVVWTVGLGILVGISVGLALAIACWLWTNHHDLIGLVVNQGSGGYTSYNHSVWLHLRQAGWHALTVVAPVTAVWVAGWAVWTGRSSRFSPPTLANGNSAQYVRLGLDRNLATLVGWIAGVLAVLGAAVLLLTAVVGRNAHVPGISFLVVPLAAAALTVLGPWLGPMINPGGGFDVAWQFTAVALPLLLCGLSPFLFRRRPVRPGTAVVAWSGFVTALLFWIATGLLSLGWSLG